MLSPIPDGYVESVCKIGQGEACCSFLAFGPGGAVCVKGSDVEPAIRERLAAGTMTAKGDNCSGPPDFKEADSGDV